MRPALTAVVLALAIVAAAAAPAGAQTSLLAPQDAADLTNDLADAQADQGICYGYTVRINGSVTDQGSSTGGPGQPVQPADCPKGFAALEADLTYTCDSCEGEDSVTANIASSLPDPPTIRDLERLGLQVSDLLGENDDTALANMTGALPLLVADRGLAAPVEFEVPAQVPAGDRATGTPGSDFLRNSWPVLALCLFLIALGPAYWLYKRRYA